MNVYGKIIGDVGLIGKMNRVQTTKMIEEIENINDKSFIAVTAYAMTGDREFFPTELIGISHIKSFLLKRPIRLFEMIREKRKIQCTTFLKILALNICRTTRRKNLYELNYEQGNYNFIP